MDKKTYVLIGASWRADFMFARPMVKEFGHCCQIIGLFDPNLLRCEAFKKDTGVDCPSYTDFDKMLKELKPDRAIITTIDKTHDHYIIKCLEAGIEPITEKPMTIDENKCRAILDAEKRTGIKVVVTFNYRFISYNVAVKEILKSGVLGQILGVDYEYILDTSHGADYYRRWHRRKENSGGLLIHKATHHFDLINWWLEEEPLELMAFGSRRVYGPTRKERGERCLTCSHTKTCEFFWDINADETTRALYSECETADQYFRDRCVFADDIDIEDTMSLTLKYSKGALLTYSLISYHPHPYEGYKVSLNGSKGILEFNSVSSPYHTDKLYRIDVYPHQGHKVTHTVAPEEGDHGGADTKLRRMLFEGNVPDPLNLKAGSFAGAVSILIGCAANKSIKEGRPIKINDLVPLDKYR